MEQALEELSHARKRVAVSPDDPGNIAPASMNYELWTNHINKIKG
jgi:hypothetical protein